MYGCFKEEGYSKVQSASEDQIIKQVSAFNYLGSTITEDARCMKEIKRRIVLAKLAFSELNNILRNTSLSMRTRM